MAAAIGASLPIHEPIGNMVVDIGGGTTEVAVISLGGVVALEAVRVGSFDIDAAIQAYVRREYGIAIGERTAEEIKLAIGSAFPTADEYKAEVRGRDLMSGLPKTIILSPEEVREAIEEQVRAIFDAVDARAGSQTPPELAQDLILHGHPPRRRRRDAARARPAHRARRPRSPCTSSTPRSSASCSAPVAASSPSTASRTCSWTARARRRVGSVAPRRPVPPPHAELSLGASGASDRGSEIVVGTGRRCAPLTRAAERVSGASEREWRRRGAALPPGGC